MEIYFDELKLNKNIPDIIAYNGALDVYGRNNDVNKVEK